MQLIFEDIEIERHSQTMKWGHQTHTPDHWFLILQEELGEAAKDFLEKRPKEARKELVQCAAVIVAFIEDLDGNHL